tara:strand:- start:1 stop:846 length:846 start_codon:yes stop_codon:yes gene_type:complete
MVLSKLKSYAKINLSLNITGKTSLLHKIESHIAFTSLHDLIFIKKIKSDNHLISFYGKFSNNIGKNNTISKLIEVLDKKNLLKNNKFKIRVLKKIPLQAGLGGGSMNAATILKYFIKKKIIKITKKEILKICKLTGSDVILGFYSTNSILTSKNQIKSFKNTKKFHILIVKPTFGCSTKEIFLKVKSLKKPLFNKPHKKMFNIDYLKKTQNQLEPIVFTKYPKLRLIKSEIENMYNPIFVRMTGSGSAIIAYFLSKDKCKNAKRKFDKKYKNYWCIASKTI